MKKRSIALMVFILAVHPACAPRTNYFQHSPINYAPTDSDLECFSALQQKRTTKSQKKQGRLELTYMIDAQRILDEKKTSHNSSITKPYLLSERIKQPGRLKIGLVIKGVPLSVCHLFR